MKKISIITIIISVFIISFLILINDIAISIRLNELKTNLQELDHNEASIDHIALIATYEIHKKIYEKRLTQENADAIEQKIQSLILKNKNYPTIKPIKNRIISFLAHNVINFNRKIIGKKPLHFFQNLDSELFDLDIAYYYERNFFFKRAISLYEKALSNKNLNNTFKASILLHQGYCYALIGLNDKAHNNYLTIIDKYSEESSAITATVLLKYLEGFKLARERVLKSNTDPIFRSQNLVNLLAYEQALNILKAAERKAKTKDLPRIKYFMARCFTGLGEPEKAVENYLQVINSSPSSEYAKYANRKLFLTGLRAGGDNRILKMSKKLNNTLKDPVLTQMIENQGENSTPEAEIEDLKMLKISDNLQKKAEKNTEDTGETKSKSSYLIIITSDGNLFKGTLIEKTDQIISLQTSIGRIDVKRDRIIRITVKE